MAFVVSPLRVSSLLSKPRFLHQTLGPCHHHHRHHRRSARFKRSRSVYCSAETEASSSSDQNDLLAWMTSKDCRVSSSIAVSNTEESNPPQLFASADIKEGEELLRIPKDACLSPEVVRKAVGEKETVELSDAQVLGLFFILEKHKGKESMWFPVISTLPPLEILNHPILWNDEDLTLLQGSELEERVTDSRAWLTEDYEMMFSRLPSSLVTKSDVSLQEYFWAQAVVFTSCPRIRQAFAIALIPACNIAQWWSTSFEGNTKLGSIATGLFRDHRPNLVATRTIDKGEVLTIARAFGRFPISNADLLFYYGLVEEPEKDNREMLNEVFLEFELSKMDPFIQDKVQILRQNQFDEKRYRFRVQAKDENSRWSPPENLVPLLRLICVERSDAYLLEPVFRGEVWDFMMEPVSKANERAMCETAISACEARLEGYAEIPENTESLGYRERAAITVVKGEQEALETAREWFQRELQCLDAKEYYQERRLRELDLLRPVDDSEIVDSEAGSRMRRAFDQNL